MMVQHNSSHMLESRKLYCFGNREGQVKFVDMRVSNLRKLLQLRPLVLVKTVKSQPHCALCNRSKPPRGGSLIDGSTHNMCNGRDVETSRRDM